LLADGSILIADEFHHVVWQFQRGGSSTIRWANGIRLLLLPENCTVQDARSFFPTALCLCRLGQRTNPPRKPRRTCRQFADEERGAVFPCFGKTAERRQPPDLRCRQSMRIRAGLSRQVPAAIWFAESPKAPPSFPRSVQRLRNNHYLVANTVQNSLVHIGRQGIRELPVNRMRGLFWPRAARRTKEGTVLIADGRSSSIVELSPSGNELRYLRLCRHDELFIMLQDPHDVRPQSNGNC